MAWFIVVGCAAAAVHWTVATACVAWAGLAPLWANVLGWLVAFGVSFAGHHHLTFRGHGVPVRDSMRRFFLLSALGFSINEATYAVALHVSRMGYQVLLGGVLVLVALLTWVLSRLWVFRTPAPA